MASSLPNRTRWMLDIRSSLGWILAGGVLRALDLPARGAYEGFEILGTAFLLLGAIGVYRFVAARDEPTQGAIAGCVAAAAAMLVEPCLAVLEPDLMLSPAAQVALRAVTWLFWGALAYVGWALSRRFAPMLRMGWATTAVGAGLLALADLLRLGSRSHPYGQALRDFGPHGFGVPWQQPTSPVDAMLMVAVPVWGLWLTMMIVLLRRRLGMAADYATRAA